ncbi:hypothetical protein B0T20DRAFT_477628 [Sordaria brevicollis]|uniref:Uncharacterized protein n=1 Tax=Sordaria brevicollis TaxID=83679 RepID=A0AAE0PH77_SORBR|nr:hypothetical protein B0T20DRAFT_477628 [Sordaria brevicollis]
MPSTNDYADSKTPMPQAAPPHDSADIAETRTYVDPIADFVTHLALIRGADSQVRSPEACLVNPRTRSDIFLDSPPWPEAATISNGQTFRRTNHLSSFSQNGGIATYEPQLRPEDGIESRMRDLRRDEIERQRALEWVRKAQLEPQAKISGNTQANVNERPAKMTKEEKEAAKQEKRKDERKARSAEHTQKWLERIRQEQAVNGGYFVKEDKKEKKRRCSCPEASCCDIDGCIDGCFMCLAVAFLGFFCICFE